MAPEMSDRITGLLLEAGTAVSNAKSRARLRGESLELVVAGERLDEAVALLTSAGASAGSSSEL